MNKVFAQVNTTIDPATLPGSTLDLSTIVNTAVGVFLTIIAIAAFAGLIYSGFLFITSSGDSEKLELAKKNITWSLTGVIISLIAYGLVVIAAGLPSALTTDTDKEEAPKTEEPKTDTPAPAPSGTTPPASESSPSILDTIGEGD